MIKFILASLAALTLHFTSVQAQTAGAKEADAVFKDFVFASGEKLPELKIHYTTLGTPVRGKDGNVTNALMILHGTGGTGKQFFQPQFCKRAFRSRASARYVEIFHYPARQYWPWRIVETERRHEDGVPEI